MSAFQCTELVQLIVSQSDSELEVQRYGMKKSTFIVDRIMLESELWMRQTAEICFLTTKLCKVSFWFLNFGWIELNFELSSVWFLEKLTSDIFVGHVGFRTPILFKFIYILTFTDIRGIFPLYYVSVCVWTGSVCEWVYWRSNWWSGVQAKIAAGSCQQRH